MSDSGRQAYQRDYEHWLCLDCKSQWQGVNAPAVCPSCGGRNAKVVEAPEGAAPAGAAAPTTLECPCCGGDGAVSDASGYFTDGQPLTCGCPGMVSVDTESDPFINNGDEPCAKCKPLTAPVRSREAPQACERHAKLGIFEPCCDDCYNEAEQSAARSREAEGAQECPTCLEVPHCGCGPHGTHRPVAEVREALRLRANRLRSFIRSHAPGGCKVLSDECECPLCDVDALSSTGDGPRQIIQDLIDAWGHSWDCSRDPGHAVMGAAIEKAEDALAAPAVSREAEGPQDALADRLDSWAQNEEMIDQHYTAHGRDCIAAAAKLRALASSAAGAQETPRWQPMARTYPTDREVFWLVVSKDASETYVDTSGRPITCAGEPRRVYDKHGRWSSLEKAIGWFDPQLPALSRPTPEEQS